MHVARVVTAFGLSPSRNHHDGDSYGHGYVAGSRSNSRRHPDWCKSAMARGAERAVRSRQPTPPPAPGESGTGKEVVARFSTPLRPQTGAIPRHQLRGAPRRRGARITIGFDQRGEPHAHILRASRIEPRGVLSD